MRALAQVVDSGLSPESLHDLESEYFDGEPLVSIGCAHEGTHTTRLKEILGDRDVPAMPGQFAVTVDRMGAKIKFGDGTPREIDIAAAKLLFSAKFYATSDISAPRSKVKVSEVLDGNSSPEWRFLKLGGLTTELMQCVAARNADALKAVGDCSRKLTELLQARWTQEKLRVDLSPQGERRKDRYIEILLRDDKSSAPIPLAHRGDGLRWFVGFLVEAAERERRSGLYHLFLFDEPGNYLHPAAQQDLVSVLNREIVRDGGSQLIYSTHSPFLLDWSRPHQLRVLANKASNGTEVINKPYHGADGTLNYWAPVRESIGLYIGDYAVVGKINVLVEGVVDQILLSYLSEEAKSQGMTHLDLGSTRIVPFGNFGNMSLLLATSKSAIGDASCLVLVDYDSGRSKAKRTIASSELPHTPIISWGELILDAHPSRDLAIEDIFLRKWYIGQVNAAYRANFDWFDREVDTSDLNENQKIADALNAWFDEQDWRGDRRPKLDKVLVATHIASSAEEFYFGNLMISWPALCEYFLNREIIRYHGITNIAPKGELARTGWHDQGGSATHCNIALNERGHIQSLVVVMGDTRLAFGDNNELLVFDRGTRSIVRSGTLSTSFILSIPSKLLSGHHQLNVEIATSENSNRVLTVPLPLGNQHSGRVTRYNASAARPGEVAGTVRWFDEQRGFGFIQDDHGEDVFVHYSEIEMPGYKTLQSGDVVTFIRAPDQRGPAARAVRIAESRIPR